MRNRRRIARLLLAAAALAGALAPAAEGTPNMRVLARVPFRNGTDLDFAGNLAFVGSQDSGYGGTRIIDISNPADPQIVGHFLCGSTQNDVGVLGSTLVVGFHSTYNTTGCPSLGGGGVRTVDVTDPANPVHRDYLQIAPNGTHTLTIVGNTGYVYANPGGLSTSAAGQTTTIVDVSNPADIKVAGSFRPPNSLGCHDVNVNATATRAYCAGSNVTQIWDITDPLNPQVVSQIVNPAIFFAHGAVPSLDGKTLVIADEAFGAHACDPTGHSPAGAFWIYDITDEENPQLLSWVSMPLLKVSALGWCTAHNFNMVPGKDWFVASGYYGGTAVFDFSNRTQPTVAGWLWPTNANTWSSYYYKGYIYTGDQARGFDVIEMDELKPPS